MKNAVPADERGKQKEAQGRVAKKDPQAERRLRRGSQAQSARDRCAPAEPVTRDAADEQEDQERTVWAASTTPTSDAEHGVARAQRTRSATGVMPVPIAEVSWPRK